MGVEAGIPEDRALRPLLYLQRMRERRGDPFAVRLDGEQLMIVGDPDLARQVFDAPADVLHAGEGNRRGLGWLYGDSSLALLDGPRHISHRRLLLPAFHRRRLERHAETTRALAEAHLDAWPREGELPLLPRLRPLAADAAVGFVLGAGEQERLGALRAALLDLHSPAARSVEGPAARGLIAETEAIVGEEVARWRGAVPSARPGGALSLLLEARGEDGSRLSDLEVRDELVTLLVAGYETTGTTLAWVLERLARHPAALAAAAAEAEEGGGPYTDAAIHETLRLRPTVPMSARLVKRPFTLGDRLVQPGAVIGLSALLIHHRSDLYPDPLSFRPERFLDVRPGTYTWIPFGGGVRRCIGAGLSLRQMRAVLSALLSRMTPRPARPEPEPMLSDRGTLAPAHGALVSLEPR